LQPIDDAQAAIIEVAQTLIPMHITAASWCVQLVQIRDGLDREIAGGRGHLSRFRAEIQRVIDAECSEGA
jgi:hypothetical protein